MAGPNTTVLSSNPPYVTQANPSEYFGGRALHCEESLRAIFLEEKLMNSNLGAMQKKKIHIS